ncbi:hypothetical protein FE257_002066 [Aspergillus nanangensis]|uniref:Aldehyde dehydrogenase domain-containing protein n=1 Tax=Aspergillus nanangensis TaxID=2582783 RepID=A0AAD4GW20_ASPNN|nr:hypothetical protein FE257_002066 [Aspergillus nanangensis]
MSDLQLARVRAAVTDGRMANVRFQQEQLFALHKSVLAHRSEIIAVLTADCAATPGEAEIEFASTVAAVRQYYTGLDFDAELADEYRIARGKSSPSRRVGHGVVLLRPTTHTRLFSVISVVGCAIAAGNTVVIESTTTHAIDSLIPPILKALDWEIWTWVEDSISDPEFLSSALIVDQTGQDDTANCIRSRPDLRAIAVVDRAADVESAAQQIIAAHLAYNSGSPHAPELVVVSEWVKKEFLAACLRVGSGVSVDQKHARVDQDAVWKTVAEAEQTGEINLLRAGRLSIVDVNTRACTLLHCRSEGNYLTVLTATSLVDAVLALSVEPEYLVAYHFAPPATGKFWSQQINSHATFVNHIPMNLLVGPALAVNHPSIPLNQRYSIEMLSRPRPEMIERPTDDIAMLEDFHSIGTVKVTELSKHSERPLKGTGQGPGTAIGFFEQGIMVGAAFIVLPVMSAVAYGGWILVRQGMLRYL